MRVLADRRYYFLQGCYIVVVPSRSDQKQRFKSTRANQPIVLARLPRVGAVQPSFGSKSYTTSEVDSHVDSQQQRSFRIDGPQAYSETEVADFAYPYEQASPQVHDFRTVNTPLPQPTTAVRAPESIPESTYPKSRISESRRRRQTSPLLKLHTQLAPFAGLIVAMALIASAGLMYWMFLGPAQIPTDYYNYPTDSFGQNEVPIPEFSDIAPPMPTFAVEEPSLVDQPGLVDQPKVDVYEVAPETQASGEVKTELQLITPLPPTESVANFASLNPVQERSSTLTEDSKPTNSESGLTAPEMLQLPKTDSHGPLDFSLILEND